MTSTAVRPQKSSIAIIGAGAAGCFAAANIPHQDDREVVIFEKSARVLQKVKVSGGGRCNVTHHLFDIPELITRYPRGRQFLKKTLYDFTPQDTIDWFEKRGVKLKSEQDGRMFPITDSSQTIIDCVWREAMRNQVLVQYHKALQRIEKTAGRFTLRFADGGFYDADRVLIACGGFPKEEQYSWLRELGHTIQAPVPSLFTFNIPAHPITSLMGVSVPEVTVKVMGTKIFERGPVLITHWGLSGPVVLRVSAWGARELYNRDYKFEVQVNWLNETTEPEVRDIISQQRREQGRQLITQKNPFQLPRRLWEFLTAQCGIHDNMRWGDLPAAAQNALLQHLIRHSFQVSGKTTFKEEFVTCGGLNLSEINPQTMESKIVPGLYFAGEIMDVDGITGGFNFQHAWASGWIAAKAISEATGAQRDLNHE